MKPSFPPLLLIALLALAGGAVRGEKADRNQPMNVEADALRYDDQKQTSVFSGRVVLTKGSIVIRGARVELRQDAQGYQFGVVTGESGKLAFFRQKREGLDEFIEGEGQTITYDSQMDTVKFSNQAQLRRYRGASLADELSGALIVYNSRTNVFSVDGSVTPASPNSPGARVRAMLSPKPEAATAVLPVPQVLPPLRATSTLGGEKE
jgi:lipopolysaccharide export system protein LptA